MEYWKSCFEEFSKLKKSGDDPRPFLESQLQAAITPENKQYVLYLLVAENRIVGDIDRAEALLILHNEMFPNQTASLVALAKLYAEDRADYDSANEYLGLAEAKARSPEQLAHILTTRVDIAALSGRVDIAETSLRKILHIEGRLPDWSIRLSCLAQLRAIGVEGSLIDDYERFAKSKA